GTRLRGRMINTSSNSAFPDSHPWMLQLALATRLADVVGGECRMNGVAGTLKVVPNAFRVADHRIQVTNERLQRHAVRAIPAFPNPGRCGFVSTCRSTSLRSAPTSMARRPST